ncbi:MAG: helix-turn-helix domain-containing protein [Armatimonadota bacterium]|nr:helix-turn-helix domain-containing protein [Armatimonadota bacterium]
MRRAAILTAQELARYLRVHEMTVYRMIQRGDLPALRVGRAWRFRKDQIDRWLTDHAINANSERPHAGRDAGGHRRRGDRHAR